MDGIRRGKEKVERGGGLLGEAREDEEGERGTAILPLMYYFQNLKVVRMHVSHVCALLQLSSLR